MAKLNALQGHVAHLARSGFDTGQEFAFTSSTGMILPVYQDLLNVGETVYFHGELFSRTQPLVTAAMADVDVYLDWFFVPLSMLFTLFPSMRYQTNDVLSSFYTSLNQAASGSLPVLDFSGLERPSVATFNSFDKMDEFNNLANGNGECKGKAHMRLLSHLGFNPLVPLPSTALTQNNTEHNPNVCPLFALAYQAIWQDYYRLPLDDYLRRDINTFNIDKHYASSTINNSQCDLYFRLHYRPRHKDYFTSVFASPIFSSVNSLGVVDQNYNLNQFKNLHDYLNGSSNTGLSLSNPSTSPQTPVIGRLNSGVSQSLAGSLYGTVSSSTASTRLPLGAIRDLFAFEKLMRIVGRAKKDYDSQVLAHFGYKVQPDIKHQLIRLYGQHGLLHIGEVVSTSDTFNGTSGASLGQISGQGFVNISGENRKFTAPCDGIIMCCYSAVPRIRYVDAFDKINSVTSLSDFFTPEYDKLGMQPIYRYEADIHTAGDTSGATRLGWQFRYSQFKRKFSRLSIGFSNMPSSTSVNQNSAWVLGQRPYGYYFSPSGTVINPQLYPLPPESYPFVLLSSPHDLDSIMQMPYQGTFDFTAFGFNPSTGAWDSSVASGFQPGIMFYTDPFVNGFRAVVKKVSTMSPYGEPDLEC